MLCITRFRTQFKKKFDQRNVSAINGAIHPFIMKLGFNKDTKWRFLLFPHMANFFTYYLGKIHLFIYLLKPILCYTDGPNKEKSIHSKQYLESSKFINNKK